MSKKKGVKIPTVVTVTNKSYQALLAQIKGEIEAGREKVEHARALTYWNIGKIINEDILKNAKRAGYGEQLCARLGKDLQVSERTVNRAVKFHREFPIPTPVSELSWSHYVELLSVSNKIQRKQLEKRAVTENLSRSALHKKVLQYSRGSGRGHASKERGAPSKKDAQRITQDAPRLVPQKGSLNIYWLITSDAVSLAKGEILVDCGFNVWMKLKRAALSITGDAGHAALLVETKKEMSYTYRAAVETVVDGDTLWAVIDLGLGQYTRQKLRLRGIDTPEINTDEGKKARDYVCKVLNGNDPILVRTSTSDKYDRYLADIYYDPEEKFLNQELLDLRLAIRYD